MLITCPYCGPRDSSEFTYQREGGEVRPDPASTDQGAWNAYVYDRVNTAGEHHEIWQHSGGCRTHVRLVRNTLTHKVSDARYPHPTTTEKAPYVRKAAADGPLPHEAVKPTPKAGLAKSTKPKPRKAKS